MLPGLIRRFPLWTGAVLIVGLACGLYWPFLNNPRVFDDWTFFSGYQFEYYATHPFGLEMRLPPYFSLAITEIEIGTMWGHRIVSLVFHIACALALCKLIYELLRTVAPAGCTERGSELKAAVWGCVGGALFAVHPVAVYGAGYLVERPIVFATLFSLLSIVFFMRGLVRGRYVDAISAALMYSVAVLSKEHSVLLPGVAVLTVFLVRADPRFAIRHSAIYLAASTPAAVFAVFARKLLIGRAYEPDYDILADQLGGVFSQGIGDFPLARSAVTQAGLFFKYLAAWIWPDTRAMSIDVRVDFAETWTAGSVVLELACFAAFVAVGILLLRRKGRLGIAGFGMLYAWIMFLVEFSAARFQEPFVLYRSYLWAPGIVIAVMALVSAVPFRAALAACVLAVPLLMYQAYDRLVTFSSSLLLWEDAYNKLPAKPIPWGSRTLYMIGREYAYAGRPEKAIAVADRCMAQYPRTVHCYYSRGVIHFISGEYVQALPYLSRAVELRPDNAVAHHRLGLVLERMGRIGEAKAEYRRASELGFNGADFELKRLVSSDGASRSGSKQAIPVPR